MRKKDSNILNKRKEKLSKRLKRKQYADQPGPLFTAQNIQYEMADRIRAVDLGGIGAFYAS